MVVVHNMQGKVSGNNICHVPLTPDAVVNSI
jgi:hypothetical protein